MNEALDWISHLPPLWGYLVLSLAAMIEYVFPPFPGDTITLLGAVLIEAVGWSLPVVMVAVTAGSVVGAWVDYEAGVWLGRADRETWLHRKMASEPIREKVDLLCVRFARHGSIYIALNRFLPGIRAFFFVVAGMSGVPRREALLWAAVSALAWNLMIVGLGYGLGFELPRLVEWVSDYTKAIYTLLLVGTVVWVGRFALQKRRARAKATIEEDKNLSRPAATDITGEAEGNGPGRS